MPTIQEALQYFLTDSAAIKRLIEGRAYPAQAPTSAVRPYIVFFRTDQEHVTHQGGTSSLASARIQIEAWADTEIGADALYRTVRDALNGFRGSLGDPGDPLTVRGAFLDDDRSEALQPSDASQTGRHSVPMEFLIWYV